MRISMRHHTDARKPGTDSIGNDGGDTDPRCCDDCGRMPLIGEHVAHYASGAMLCELCRVLHAGRPVRESLVKHSADGDGPRVRVLRRRVAA